MALDVEFVRSQFPAFSSAELAGHAFFENAGGSYTCGAVIDRLTRFYTHRKVQPYAPYAASELGGAEMDEARARLAAMMGVDSDEVSFGPSTSANTFVLAQALRRMITDQGGAVVVTNQDHEANSGVWRRLAEDGIEVREWKVDPQTGHLALADLRAFLADGAVRMVCFPHCSNVVAEVNPVAEICAIARAAGAYTCVDGVSYAPHGFPDMNALGADIYCFRLIKLMVRIKGLWLFAVRWGRPCPHSATFQRRGFVQTVYASGAGPCASGGLCGDGRLYRRALCPSCAGRDGGAACAQ